MDLTEMMEQNSIEFIDNNIDDLKKGINDSTLLLKIVFQEDIEALKHFINSGLDINLRMNYGRTIIHSTESTSVSFLEEMVALGLNIHAVDNNGDTALLILSEKGLNVELQTYLMNNGLNPYNCNYRRRNCYSYVKINRQNISVDYYAQFPYSNADPMVSTLLLEGKHEMALDTIYFEINNIGGFQCILNNIHNSHYAGMFCQLQNCLSAMGKIEEANTLLKIFNGLPRKTIAFFKEIAPSPVPAFILKDYDTLYDYLDVIARGTYTTKTQQESALLQGFIFAKIAGAQEDVTDRRKIMNSKRFKQGLYPAFVKKLITSKTEYEIEEREKMLNIMANSTMSSKSSEIRLNEGLYYLQKGDLITAEMKLRQVISTSYDLRYTLKEFHSAKLLIDYIQNLQLETK